jgi:hypothetical protein
MGPDDQGPTARSPRFPFISLAHALQRVRQIQAWQKEREGQSAKGLERESVSQAWNLKRDSSAVAQTLAALRQYGLLELCDGEDRRLQLSPLARRLIIEDVGPSERAGAAKEAALRPKIFSELWEVARARGFDRDVLTEHLTDDWGMRFTSKAADNVWRVFNETMKYAGLHPKTPQNESRSASRKGGAVSACSRESSVSEWADPLVGSQNDWSIEPFTDPEGQLIVWHRGKPSRKMYEYIRDYFALKARGLDESD